MQEHTCHLPYLSQKSGIKTNSVGFATRNNIFQSDVLSKCSASINERKLLLPGPLN